MHPVIRIINFLVLAILLARAHPMQMGWVLCVIGLVFIFEKGKGLTSTFILMWRIRWLILSILLLYVWIPIGSYTDSLWLAGDRIAVLLIMLLALQSLVLNMSRNNIVMGLYAVLLPLKFIGLSRELFVLRLVLTLDSIAQLPNVLNKKENHNEQKGSRIKNLVDRLINAVMNVLTHSEKLSLEPVRIETNSATPIIQWLLPVSIVLVFFSLSNIG